MRPAYDTEEKLRRWEIARQMRRIEERQAEIDEAHARAKRKAAASDAKGGRAPMTLAYDPEAMARQWQILLDRYTEMEAVHRDLAKRVRDLEGQLHDIRAEMRFR